MIPPPLWDAYDNVQINFTIAHIRGKKNTTADFLSSLDIDPLEKLIVKIREDVPTQPIGFNLQSTGITPEDQVFLHTDEIRLPSEEQLWQSKRNVVPTEAALITVSHCYINDHCTYTLMQSMERFNKVPRVLIEQNADLVLPNFKRQMLGLPFDEQVLATNLIYTLYRRNGKRIIIEHDILYRQYYNDVRHISHVLVLLPV